MRNRNIEYVPLIFLELSQISLARESKLKWLSNAGAGLREIKVFWGRLWLSRWAYCTSIRSVSKKF